MEPVGFELEDAAQFDIAMSPIWSMNKPAAKEVAAEAGQEPEFQFDRLYSVHDPASGSYAFYAQYANQIPFVPVVSVGDLVAPTKTKHRATLTENGARFAEWLVERTIPPSTGPGSGVVPDDVLASAVGEAATAGTAGEDLSKEREAWGSLSSCDEVVSFWKTNPQKYRTAWSSTTILFPLR